MFEEILVRKLIEAQESWSRERAENEIPAKQLVFCWKRYTSKDPKELMQNPRVIIGTLVHRGIEHYFGFEDKEDNVVKKQIGEYVIVGMPDLIMDDVVFEFKYSTSPPKEPKEWDINQLKIYLWLTGKPVGELVYITPLKIKTFKVTEPSTDEEILGWIRYRWAKYRWECATCPFRHECGHRLV